MPRVAAPLLPPQAKGTAATPPSSPARSPGHLQRFQELLDRVRERPDRARRPGVCRDESSQGQGSQGQGSLEPPISMPGSWFRPEGPPGVKPSTRAAPLPPVPPSDRLLVGTGPTGGEARLRIGHGPLAGSEIHLRDGPRGVDVSILTHHEASRQTLTVAMDEVARRLERKGYLMRMQPAGGSSRPAPDRQRQPGR